MPNLVLGGANDGFGHPGFANCTTRQTAENTLESLSLNQTWHTRWTFFDSHARLDVLLADSAPYWFLYEGTPAGRYAPAAQPWGNSLDGPRHDQPDYVLGSGAYGAWQWAYAGDDSVKRSLLVVKPGAAARSTFSFLGNSEAGTSSADGMVLLGLGRGQEVDRYLRGTQSFVVSLLELNARDSHAAIAAHAERFLQDKSPTE